MSSTALPGLDSYDVDPAYHDEAFAASMTPRPQYTRLLERLIDIDLRRLQTASAQAVDKRGVRFRSSDGLKAFQLDPIPRIFAAEEWDHLEAGVVQRGRALNEFAADVYGERRIVAAGRVPERVIEGADQVEPAMAGVEVPHGTYCGVLGLDVVRASDGRLRVLEDNARTPSGLAYADAALDVVDELLPQIAPARVSGRGGTGLLLDVLRAAAPNGVHEPVIALLSDGPANSAWWEHEAIAGAVDIPIVTLDDLETAGGRLHAWIDGRRVSVDVVYRRTNEDRLTDSSGRLTTIGEALWEPIAAGRLSCVNAFGAGVVDDKLVHAYVEEMVRFYLGEEPLLTSVKTYDLVEPDQRAECLERLDEMVVKPRAGQGGHGVIVCAHARPEDRAEAARQIAERPERFVAQELVAISRHPTVRDGVLVPRHVDLRPFVLSAGDCAGAVPGALTRVAFAPGALVVNSSQDGGAKATWVVPTPA